MTASSDSGVGGKPALGIEPPVVARALLLGERLDTRGFEHQETLGRAPLVARVNEGGIAVLFRYGALVVFNVTPAAEKALIGRLRPLVTDALESVESEELRIAVHPEAEEQIDLAGALSLRDLSVERIQLIADVLAKSLTLGHYETRVAGAFDRIEPLAQTLGQSGRAGSEGKVLLRQIGGVLGVQHKIVGRVGTAEKPDLLWDHPELERLYARLSEEYELRERDRALDRKLEVISRTVETLLGLVQQRSSIRVEWYIVILIVVEIVISVFSSIAK